MFVLQETSVVVLNQKLSPDSDVAVMVCMQTLAVLGVERNRGNRLCSKGGEDCAKCVRSKLSFAFCLTARRTVISETNIQILSPTVASSSRLLIHIKAKYHMKMLQEAQRHKEDRQVAFKQVCKGWQQAAGEYLTC